jgi:hypothetical protein
VVLGEDFSICLEEVEGILLTARVNSVLHGYTELGRATIDLSELLGNFGASVDGDANAERQEFLAVKLRRKKSGRIVGTATVTVSVKRS